MTLRLSALFESRVQVIRQAYALSIANDVHLTRARTRNRRRGLNVDTNILESEITNGNIEVPIKMEIISDVADNVFSPVASNSECSSSKSILEKDIVKLDEFIKRPVTRSRRPNTNYQNGVGCSKNTKDYTGSSGASESDSNCSEDDRKSSVSSYEDMFKKLSGISQKSNRIFKRCRYNYDSDNIGASGRKKIKINNGESSIRDYKSELTNNESPKKTTKTIKASSSQKNNKLTPKATRKTTKPAPKITRKTKEAVGKTSRNNNVSVPRTSRNRTAINYYEDDFDPFDMLMEEDNKSNHSNSSGHEQDDQEEEDVEQEEEEEEAEDKEGDASENDASENDASENEASENEASENEASENEASENEASENEASENEASENEANKNEGSSFESDGSSTSHEDVPAVFSGVSSRGRIRKAASRFNDFVDK